MNTPPRVALVLGPGIGAGLVAFLVTLAVLLLLAPPAVPYLVEAVVSFTLLAFAFVLLGIAGAAYVDEARRGGPRVPVWLGASTGALVAVAVLILCASASLFPIVPVVAVRVFLILGLGASLGVLAAVLLVDRLQAGARAETVAQESISAVNAAMRSLEDALASSAPTGDSAVRMRRVLERHRTSIEPMSHVATLEDQSLADSVAELTTLIREPGREAGQPGLLAAALRSLELSQERRIVSQVKRG